MNYVLELLKPSTFQLLWSGLKLTLYISSISVILSILFGMILAIMRNGKNPIFKWIATIYIEFVRNVPNLLWIFTVFLVFQMKSTPAGITAFTIFTTAAMAEIIRGGLNAIGPGQTELVCHRVLPQCKSWSISSCHRPFARCCPPSSLRL